MKSSTSVLPTTLNPSQSRISEMASSITLRPKTSNLPEITPSYDIEKKITSPTITTSISQNRKIMSTITSSTMTTMMTSPYTEMPMPNEQSKKSGQTDDEKGKVEWF